VTPRRLVLVDAIGALVSALLMGVVLPLASLELGVSAMALRALGAVAAGFLIASTTAYFVARSHARYLRHVAIANLAYAVGSLAVFATSSDLTGIGLAYVLAEAVVIGALARYELSVARREPSGAAPR